LKIKSIIFFLFYFTFVFSQNETPNYSTIDSLARTVEYKGDLYQLTTELTQNCNTKLEKARAIFIWVTHSIKYDYKLINKNKKTKPFRCRNNQNCDAKYVKWKNKYINKTLKSKKAICHGYATLFKQMCDYVGIQSSIISGYTKKSHSQIGRMGSLNHAWNAIHINGEYYFLDPTWAAGYCSIDKKEKLLKYVKKYEDYYWLTPSDKFSRNHYPEDEFWARYSGNKEDFRKTPYIKTSYLPHLEIITPKSGIINIKAGDTLHFNVKYNQPIEHLQINTNIYRNPIPWTDDETSRTWNERALKKQKYINFKYQNEIYSFDYIVKKDYLRYIDILFDYKRVIRFRCTNQGK